jgi:hypothetical protein
LSPGDAPHEGETKGHAFRLHSHACCAHPWLGSLMWRRRRRPLWPRPPGTQGVCLDAACTCEMSHFGKGWFGFVSCQLKNQPPIPRERYVLWCIQNTQKHGLTLTWTRERPKKRKGKRFRSRFFRPHRTSKAHWSTHMRGLFDQTCPRHGVRGQTTPPAAALPTLPIPTHIQSQSCLGLTTP